MPAMPGRVAERKEITNRRTSRGKGSDKGFIRAIGGIYVAHVFPVYTAVAHGTKGSGRTAPNPREGRFCRHGADFSGFRLGGTREILTGRMPRVPGHKFLSINTVYTQCVP